MTIAMLRRMSTMRVALSLVVLGAVLISLVAREPVAGHASGSGRVAFPTAAKRIAIDTTDPNDLNLEVDAQSIQTLSNCYADPSVVQSGSGATVSYATSSVTDTSKSFPNLSGKAVTVSGQTIVSGPAPAYTLTTVSDASANYGTNALAGLTITTDDVIGSGGTVTYMSTTVADTSKNFTVNQLAGRSVFAGASSGTVASNTATTITLTASWTGGTPVGGTFYDVQVSTRSAIIASNTATTMTIAGVWSPSIPVNGASFTINVPAAKVSGTAGPVTYTRTDTGGAGTTYGSNTLSDPTKTGPTAWVTNEFAGARVSAGASSGVVTSNTSSTLTLTAPWTGGTPASDTTYTIFASVVDSSKTFASNAFNGLNVVAVTSALSDSGSGATYGSFTRSGAPVTYGSSSMTDTMASFPTGSGGLNGKTIVVGDVTGTVSTNTATTITLMVPWSTQPLAGSAYVVAWLTDTSPPFGASSLGGRTVVSGANQAVVQSSSANTLTLKTAWSPATPANNSAYTVTPQASGGTAQSNTGTQISLNPGWFPFTPPAGTTYYVQVTTVTGTIQSNTSQTLTMTAPWSPAVPTNGSSYSVINTQPISPCGLGAYTSTLTYDPTKLQYVSATNGPFLTSTGRPLFVNPCLPSTTSNSVTMACTTTGSTPLGPSGSGALYNVKFRPPVIAGSGASISYSSFSSSGVQVTYGASTMTDNLANFPTPNGLAGKTIVVGSFTGVIASNTMTTVTLMSNWTTQPNDQDKYVIATMTDPTKSFATNSLAGQTIVSGSNSAVVYSNTATALTLKTPWSPATPATGASYNLFSAVVNTQTTIGQASALTDVQGAGVDHTDGGVTILFSRCADVSGNGAVSLGDPLQILSLVGKTSSDPNWSQYSRNDMNQNGAISLTDVLYALDEVGQLCVYTP